MNSDRAHSERRASTLDDNAVELAQVAARARLAHSLPRRWAHTQGVAAAAQRLSRHLPQAGRAAVAAGSWLHDVAYAPGLVETGFHPLDGAMFAQGAGFHPVIVSLIAHHTGADSEAYERGLLYALARFPPPPAPLLDVLTCADLTTSPTGTLVDPAERIAEILTRYPPGDPVHRAVQRSRPCLLAAAARVHHMNRARQPGWSA